MLAVRLYEDGLKLEEIETPSPDAGEVLVRVHAAAITRGELETMNRPSLSETVSALHRAMRGAGVEGGQVSAVPGARRAAGRCRRAAAPGPW